MRSFLTLMATLICGASLCAAQASATLSAPARGARSLPNGLNFTYDAQHDQINSSGLAMKAHAQSDPTITPTTGTINVTINAKLVSHFPKGTKIHYSLTVIGGQIDVVNGAIDGAIETAYAEASAGSGTSSVTLTIPYSWALPQDPIAANGLILAFGASAVNPWPDSSKNDVYRSTLQVDGVESLPANGATASYVFDVTL